MEKLQIVLLVETSRQLGRSILKGTIRWSHLYGPAAFIVSAGHLHQALPKLEDARRVGILARVSDPGVLQAICKRNIPTVVLEPNTEELTLLSEKLNLCVIRVNSRATGICAADYLIGQGFQQFAFCGFSNRIWSKKREKAFVERIGEHSFSCKTYPTEDREVELSEERERLRSWLLELPHGTALMACDDDRARQILDICEREGIKVPRDLAILGAADDELLCELSSPPLSSVAFNFEQAGFEAMKTLAALIAGSADAAKEVVVDPLWVTPRMSTDFVAHADRLVVEALRYIRRNYFRPIGAVDVVRYVEVSRRTLESRFFAATGRTLMEDIVHQRVERAKQLLASTDETIDRVGTLAGFFSYRSMLRAFGKFENCSPSDYRKRSQKHLVAPPQE